MEALTNKSAKVKTPYNEEKYFFLHLWGISMNLKIIEVLIVSENLNVISDFLVAWFVVLFSTVFSLNEHQIKEESSPYKKRPLGQ